MVPLSHAIIIALLVLTIAGANPLIWLNSTKIRSHIGAIFDRIGNIDIIIGDDYGPDQMDQIDYLLRREDGVLQAKSFRVYGEAFTDEEGCTGDRPLLSARVRPIATTEHTVSDTMDRDYEDEFEFIQWDRSYETFVKIWDQNHDDGYVIFTNLSTFETLIKCLLDPAATYLLVLPTEEDFQRDEVFTLLTSIWNHGGVYRLFVLAGEHIHTYDPFLANGSSYGVLMELVETDSIPKVPQTDFKGYPLRIEMFRSTYSNEVPGNDATNVDFIGADVVTSWIFAKTLNFTPIRIPPDKYMFGDLLPNGTFNGAIGRLARHDSDIAFVGFFIKDYYSRDIEFTAGMYTDEICCLVKKASRVPEYLLPITIFPTDLWGLLFLMGIVCSVTWIIIRAGIRSNASSRKMRTQKLRLAYLFNLTNDTRDAPMYQKMLRICVDTYIILMSAPYRRFTRSGIERLLLSGIVMVSLIFVSMFQSGLSSVFVNPVYYKDIDSLQQLDQSGLKIPVKYKGFLDDVFPANYSSMMESLRSKMVYEKTEESMLARVARLGTISTVTRRSTLTLDNAIYLSTKQLFMVSECPRTYNLGFVVSRHSVMLERINGVLLRILNGGLLGHWVSQMTYNITLQDMERVRNAHESNFKILTILDMQFPFYLLAIGLVISTGAFIAEQVYYRCMT